MLSLVPHAEHVISGIVPCVVRDELENDEVVVSVLVLVFFCAVLELG